MSTLNELFCSEIQGSNIFHAVHYTFIDALVRTFS